jgi:hypothetical protein
VHHTNCKKQSESYTSKKKGFKLCSQTLYIQKIVIEITFNCHQGHFDHSMVNVIDFGCLGMSLWFRMAMEICLVTIKFNQVGSDQTYFDHNPLTYFAFDGLAVGWQSNLLGHHMISASCPWPRPKSAISW